MKQCTKCSRVLPPEAFNKHSRGRDGLRPHCRDCQKAYHFANRERELARNKVRYAEKRDEYIARSTAWHYANREQELERMKANYWADVEANRVARREDYRKNKPAYVARAKARKAHVRRATPPWADMSKITEFYKLAQFMRDITGDDYHVDHIVPLQGELVCGLHVPCNLQVLPGVENQSKYNRFEVEA